MEKNTNNNNIFAKYPALKVVAGVVVLVALFLGVQAFRNSGQLEGQKSDASCYGYNCQPSVIIGGRVVSTGYRSNPISYGTLIVKPNSLIELTWSGANVDSCKADWTKFIGSYMPLTIYPKKLSGSQNFGVSCYKNQNKVGATLVVKVAR